MSDKEISETIAKVYKELGVVVDPHTACAFKDLPTDCTKVLLSTAHSAKFPELIEKTLSVHPTSESLEKLLNKQIVKTIEDADASKIRSFIEANGIM
jgi:threonine synthase